MRVYIKFLINLFNISFLKVFFSFFLIILITNIIEQTEFFKNLDISFFYLIFLSFLKKSICSKILVIRIIIKKVKKTFKKELLKRLIKNLI